MQCHRLSIYPCQIRLTNLIMGRAGFSKETQNCKFCICSRSVCKHLTQTATPILRSGKVQGKNKQCYCDAFLLFALRLCCAHIGTLTQECNTECNVLLAMSEALYVYDALRGFEVLAQCHSVTTTALNCCNIMNVSKGNSCKTHNNFPMTKL